MCNYITTLFEYRNSDGIYPMHEIGLAMLLDATADMIVALKYPKMIRIHIYKSLEFSPTRLNKMSITSHSHFHRQRPPPFHPLPRQEGRSHGHCRS